MTSDKCIYRTPLIGLIFKLFGYKHYGLELASGHLKLFGPDSDIPFDQLSDLIKAKEIFGFAKIVLKLNNGDRIQVTGLHAKNSNNFVTLANQALRDYIFEQFKATENHLNKVTIAIGKLNRPNSYPAACKVEKLLKASKILQQKIPIFIPDGTLTNEQLKHLQILRAFLNNPQKIRERAISKFLERETKEMQSFFDEIESHPLTSEQRKAVMTDEDATLVLAGAGSGKTSVIVAKTAYLIQRKFRKPHEIVLLAFGKDAAKEMKERIEERTGDTVDAFTFHKLGNTIIREVEGRPAPLANHAADESKIGQLIKSILLDDIIKKHGLGHIFLKWFSEFFIVQKNEWDFKTRGEYYQWVEANELRTLNGEIVKSFDELEISNWLFCNGIEYEYEPRYEHKLPNGVLRQYRPDFRLTESGIYLEHFGIRRSKDSDGTFKFSTAPGIDCDRYMEEMEWKRELHKDHGTTLLETYSYDRHEGGLIQALAERVKPHVKCAPLSEDQIFDTLSKFKRVDDFTKTVSTFLKHFKSTCMSISDCRKKGANGPQAARNLAFMNIFEPLFEIYQDKLGDDIDFEDMIVRSTKYVESGQFQSSYKHILVDEFQDISGSRADLIRALQAQHRGARIYGVGDDWQAIYRFSGSDIHIMREFGKEFGGTFGTERNVHSTVNLGRTFRSVDKIALPARHFVLQNPAQIEKTVEAKDKSDKPAIYVAYYSRDDERDVLVDTLRNIAKNNSDQTGVMLLGRYNFNKPDYLNELEQEFSKLKLRYLTAHKSKGLEDDHVIILKAESQRMGFPSQIIDDPLFNLVLPKPEGFEFAEERRLFYVALTRARKSVTILTNRNKPSVFVRELLASPEYHTVEINDSNASKYDCTACGDRLVETNEKGKIVFSCEHKSLCGAKLNTCTRCGKEIPLRSADNPDLKSCACGAKYEACSKCEDGWLVERKGKYGKFRSCIRFPHCDFSTK